MLAKIIKGFFESIGLDIKRYSIAQNQNARLYKILQDADIDLVYDIGANTGQFAKELRKMGYRGKVISFEPLPDAYTTLCKESKNDLMWEVAPRTAIGDMNGDIEINIAGNSASSSILSMHDNHLKAAPITASIGKIAVPIKKIDFFYDNYLQKNSILFIKIDTQGYEDTILNGGVNTIARAKVLQMELSLTELYEGQKLIIEMIDKAKKMGFDLWGLEPAFIDSNDGRMLQVDAIFRRPDLD